VRRIVTLWLLGTLGISACKDHAPSPAEIADRGWRAHELAVAAGEHAKTCAEAGAAMQQVITEHREDFAAAFALDQDANALAEAIDYMAAHQDRYADLETRMEALSARCAGEPTVDGAFQRMESP
jgi:hypothetical protein